MVKVLIKKLNESVSLPQYKTEGSSGMDLKANIDNPVIIKPNKTNLIPTGISIAIPNGYEIQIRPRSGLAAKNNISVLNTPGTIDADYRGEIKVILINLGDKNFKIEPHDRIAQMVLCPVLKAEMEEIDELPKTIRGDGGFGSTGR